MARDGGIFALAAAAFFGSTGAITLNRPRYHPVLLDVLEAHIALLEKTGR